MPKRTESQNDLLLDFTRFYILTILFEGPAHGYKILGRFKESVGKDVSPSLVYPFLEKLEKKGLIKCTVTSTGEKERKVFELTNEGKIFCAGLFRRFSSLVSIALEPSLMVCAHCGCKVFEGGYHEVIESKELAFCCKYCAHSYIEETKYVKKVVEKEFP